MVGVIAKVVCATSSCEYCMRYLCLCLFFTTRNSSLYHSESFSRTTEATSTIVLEHGYVVGRRAMINHVKDISLATWTHIKHCDANGVIPINVTSN